MEKSKIVNIQQYKTNNIYYNIGLVVGAIRAGLETGTVSLDAACSLLPDALQKTIQQEFACMGGAR